MGSMMGGAPQQQQQQQGKPGGSPQGGRQEQTGRANMGNYNMMQSIMGGGLGQVGQNAGQYGGGGGGGTNYIGGSPSTAGQWTGGQSQGGKPGSAPPGYQQQGIEKQQGQWDNMSQGMKDKYAQGGTTRPQMPGPPQMGNGKPGGPPSTGMPQSPQNPFGSPQPGFPPPTGKPGMAPVNPDGMAGQREMMGNGLKQSGMDGQYMKDLASKGMIGNMGGQAATSAAGSPGAAGSLQGRYPGLPF